MKNEQKKVLLIVDDAPTNRSILNEIFNKEFKVLEAEDGVSALKTIDERKDIFAIFLDLGIPKKNGFEILEHMKNSKTLRDIPVIAVTSDVQSEYHALECGAWDFIAKPYNPKIVKFRFENVVNRKLLNELTDRNFKLEAKTQIFRYINDMPCAYMILKYDLNEKTDTERFVYEYCNERYAQILNKTINEIVGQRLSEFYGKHNTSETDSLLKVATFGKEYNFEMCLNIKKQEYFTIYVYSPKNGYCACMLMDTTELHDLQKSNIEVLERENKLLIQRSVEQDRYKIITEHTGSIVFEWNNLNKSFYASNNLNEFAIGLQDPDQYKKPLEKNNYLSIIHNEDIDKFFNEFIDKIIKEEDSSETTVRLKKISGEYVWCKIYANCLYDDSGVLLRTLGTIKDVNNEYGYLQKLKKDAEFDSLTGIYNKQSFFKYASELIEKNKKEEFVIIRFDIDRFKVINEMFGHDKGDELLVYIAKKIEKRVEVFKKRAYGRLEADVFCICVRNLKIDVDDLLNSLEHVTDDYEINFDIVPSIGIFYVKDRELSVDVMCDRAKLALTKIKGNYLLRRAYFDENMHLNLIKEQEIINSMNSALEKEQFVVYFQPKYSLSDNKISGAEALVRWIHSEKGMIYPSDFIPVFERNGFIMKLDEYVLEKTCQFLSRQFEDGKTPFPISVNISKINLYNPVLCETIIGLVKKYKLPPKYLQLELTESTYTDNKKLLISIMTKLQSYGFIIMMDDFGSGYSSLNMLKELPVDVLKIDMRFLSGDSKDGKGGKILSSVVKMAKWLKLHVITEGVETKEQADFLRSIGCEDAQGYYFAKPMPMVQYEKLVNSNEEINDTEKFKQLPEKINIDEIWDLNTKLSLLFNGMSSAIGIYELNNNEFEPIRLNDKYFEMIKMNREDFYSLGLHVIDFIHEDDRKIVTNMFEDALNTKNIGESIFRRKLDTGEYLWLHAKIRYIGGDNLSSSYFVVMNDVTDLKKAEEKLMISDENLKVANEQLKTKYNHERMYRKTVVENSIIFFEMDLTDNKIIDGKFQQLKELGFYKKEGIEKLMNFFLKFIVHPEDKAMFKKKVELKYLKKLYEGGIHEIKFEFRMKNFKNSKFVWIESTLSMFKTESPNHLYCTWFGKDINNRKTFELSLKELSEKDALTGLYNCIAYQKIIDKYLDSGKDGILFMLDIDNFKKINDIYGHLKGDKILIFVANAMKKVFDENAYIARMGGDEYSAFLPNTKELSVARNYADLLCKEVFNIPILDNIMFSVSCSLGVSITDSENNTFQKLYLNADKAQYLSKRTGKNRFEIFENDSIIERKPKILIADDAKINRTLLRAALQSKYEIIEVCNGEEAENILNTNGSEISVVILDNIMPKKTGLEVLSSIRENIALSHLAIIMMTMYSEPEIKLEALNRGVLYFIDKPFEPAMVSKLVDNIFSEKYSN